MEANNTKQYMLFATNGAGEIRKSTIMPFRSADEAKDYFDLDANAFRLAGWTVQILVKL